MNDTGAYETPKSNLELAHDKQELENILIIAKRQKALVYTFLVYFLIAGFSGSAAPEVKPLIQLAALPLAIAIVVFTARLTLRVYSSAAAIFMIIFSIIPLINLFIVLMANSRANKLIKSKGFRVGLVGANTKEIEAAV